METLQGETACFQSQIGQKLPSQCQPRPFYRWAPGCRKALWLALRALTYATAESRHGHTLCTLRMQELLLEGGGCNYMYHNGLGMYMHSMVHLCNCSQRISLQSVPPWVPRDMPVNCLSVHALWSLILQTPSKRHWKHGRNFGLPHLREGNGRRGKRGERGHEGGGREVREGAKKRGGRR